MGIVDEKNPGNDAGVLLNGVYKGIPVYRSVGELLEFLDEKPAYCLVGMATAGGIITPYIIKHGISALKAGISLISGLHNFIGENNDLIAAARAGGSDLIDIRNSKPRNELNFWKGEILSVKAPRIAVLGTDCNLGKRTTAQLLVDNCLENGIKAEMIFTGQTGWLQGGKYGFILDTTMNDFVSGELEYAITTCDKKESPDVIFLEGQSALRNPSGPCGSELIVSGKADGVILQYGPGYRYYQGFEEIGWEIGSVRDEMELVRLYGSEVMAITLNMTGIDPGKEKEVEEQIRDSVRIPVVNVMRDGTDELFSLVESLIKKFKKA